MLGVTASWGGQITEIQLRKLALIEFLYAFGYIISYFALQNESFVVAVFHNGIVGGIGLGLHLTPVATVSKWFPTNKV